MESRFHAKIPFTYGNRMRHDLPSFSCGGG
jgi:hypothetical protein